FENLKLFCVVSFLTAFAPALGVCDELFTPGRCWELSVIAFFAVFGEVEADAFDFFADA
ncbi:MAG: hypothetical protein JWO95_2829, partial [Verrucomicrobiales bacterium]|nr:hypothetical protein [Verrucomicrobiales bacterium]